MVGLLAGLHRHACMCHSVGVWNGSSPTPAPAALGSHAGLLTPKPGSGEEMSLVAEDELPPAVLGVVRQLRLMAASAWWADGHPGWAIFKDDAPAVQGMRISMPTATSSHGGAQQGPAKDGTAPARPRGMRAQALSSSSIQSGGSMGACMPSAAAMSVSMSHASQGDCGPGPMGLVRSGRGASITSIGQASALEVASFLAASRALNASGGGALKEDGTSSPLAGLGPASLPPVPPLMLHGGMHGRHMLAPSSAALGASSGADAASSSPPVAASSGPQVAGLPLGYAWAAGLALGGQHAASGIDGAGAAPLGLSSLPGGLSSIPSLSIGLGKRGRGCGWGGLHGSHCSWVTMPHLPCSFNQHGLNEKRP